ncbi:MAG: hypothetical protein P8J18_08880 [Halieaceae bacterium]|nr:hypothetical protein [Halieaceae bacterium]
MSTPKPLSDRKIIRKMSQQLGMLDRGWIEKKSSKNRNSRKAKKLKSLWSAWDEDPSVRPVICQRIKQLTYETFYDQEKTIQSLANIILEVISSESKILSKKVVMLDGKELLRVIHEGHSDSIDINLQTTLKEILNVSETTEHQANG